MRRSASDGAGPAEDAVVRDQKEIMTKAEYNRWVVRQENSRMAEEARQESKSGEEIIKERQRQHTAQGLSRQQAAMVQMKRASESLEAHRQQNLTIGRKVYEEVAGWRQGAKATKDDWAAYGKNIKEEQKKNNATAAAVGALKEAKLAQAANTRTEDQSKEAERERLRKEHEKNVTAAATAVRTQTSDEVVDASKRIFYEQRLKAAQDTRAASAVNSKERTERKAAWSTAQTKRRNKAKTARGAAKTSRDNLLASRTAAAVAMRESKAALSAEHKERMQENYLSKAAAVKAVIANSIYTEGDAATGGSPPGIVKPPSPKSQRPRSPTGAGEASPAGFDS